jgi:hypothetical protein
MWDWLFALDPVTGTFTLPLWAAGTAALLFLITFILALWRAGAGQIVGAFAQVAIVLIIALAAWTFHAQSLQRDRDAERRALDARASELTARTVLPGSALACLDAIAAEALENSCEHAVFGSAETAAAALSYVAARVTLLADALSYAKERDPSYELVLADWRRTLETDRFGVVAQVMATRDGCGADECPAFSLLRDSSRVSANLRERAFDQHVARHAAAWGTRAGTPVAAATAPGSVTTPPGAPSPSLASSSTSGPVFPSAASIPAVSIMNAEPTGSVLPGVASAPPTAGTPATTTATAEPIANPPTPPRRPPPQPRRPAAAAPTAVPAPGPPPAASAPNPARAQ